MNKNTIIILGVLGVIVFAVIVLANNKEEMIDEKMNDSAMMDKERDTMVKDDVVAEDKMMNEDDMDMMDEVMEKDDSMMRTGSYEVYSAEKVVRAETGDVVLFFHASWCPSCRGLNSDIEANLGSIPEGLSILKVDYDSETELKKKYGVTYQHTFVQVDKDGNLIKKWSGSPKLTNLVAEVQ